MKILAIPTGKLLRAFPARSATRPFWEVGVFTNLWLLGVVLVSILGQIGLHQLHVLQTLLRIGPLSVADGLLCLTLGVIPAAVIEIAKIVRRLTVGEEDARKRA